MSLLSDFLDLLQLLVQDTKDSMKKKGWWVLCGGALLGGVIGAAGYWLIADRMSSGAPEIPSALYLPITTQAITWAGLLGGLAGFLFVWRIK